MANGVRRNVCVPAGQVVFAEFTSTGPRFINPKIKQTGNRLVGLKYEAKAHDYIARQVAEQDVIGLTAMASPWIVFRSEGDHADRVRYCQPDHLILDLAKKCVTIVEIKLQHCQEAHQQVRQLYEPVVKKLYPSWTIAALELVQWHDPHTPFPESYYFEPNVLACQADRFAVHIWNPRYEANPKSKRAAPASASVSPPTPST